MELIKIDQAINEYMDDSISDENINEYFSKIKESIYAKNSKEIVSVNEDMSELIGAGIGAVAVIIIAITKWLKNKYRITIKKLVDQSKELNDIYTKVEDMLKHDKMARFKHRNDSVDVVIKYIVLHDTRDPRKYYNLTLDMLAYDPEYFINEIDSIMKYVNEQSKDKENDLVKMRDSVLSMIDESFEKNHWFVRDLAPMMKIENYRGLKLEKILVKIKDQIGIIYNNIYTTNKTVSYQLKYMQIMQQAYNRCISMYGKDKASKEMVDSIFKKLLDNMTTSMEFNSKIMALMTEEIKHYVEELEKIYTIIRS